MNRPIHDKTSFRAKLDPPRPLDTLNQKPRIRHLATYELAMGWVLTKCHRKVINFFWADNTSLTYTDGSVYARKCEKCFEGHS